MDGQELYQLQGLVPIYPRQSLLGASNPSAAVPGDITERRYFELFREEVAFILCGYFQSPFWTRVIPQTCHHEPAIRHEVVALSALYKSSKSTSNAENGNETHRNFAFLQQSKALRYLRESLSGGNQTARLPLMASLVFFCFESLHGNWETSLQQLSSGRNLLKHCQTLGGDKKALRNIGPEIPQALERLETVMLSFLVMNPVSDLPLPDEEDYKELRDSIPDQLKAIEDGYPIVVKSATLALKHIGRAARFATSKMSNISSKSVAQEMEQLEEGFQLWRKTYEVSKRALQPLLGNKIANVMSKEYLGALTLYIQGEVFDTMMLTSMDLEEAVFDSFLKRFQLIVSSSRFLLETEQQFWGKGEAALKFGMGLVVCLYYTATRCRDSAVRREAIATLRERPSRCGVWDSLQAAKVAEWVADLEDDGRDINGFVPEQWRVRMRTLRWTLNGGFINVQCMQGPPGGTLDLQEAAIPC